MIWAVVIAFALIALIDFLPLLQRKKRRAAAAFACMFAAALTLQILAVLNVRVPSMMSAWESLIKWLGMGYPP